MESARAPLTPPDTTDTSKHSTSLQNGHIVKDLSFQPEHHKEFTSPGISKLNDESSLINAQLPFNPLTHDAPSDTKPASELPSSNREEAPSTLLNHSTHQENNSPPPTQPVVNTLEPSASIAQPPTSDLREETRPISSEKTAEIKAQKEQEDLERDPELARGLAAGGSEPIQRTQVIDLESAAVSSQPSEPAAPEITDDYSSQVDSDDKPDHQNPPETSIATNNLPHHPPVPVPEGAALESPVDPTPSPAEPVPQPTQTETTKDIEMQDAPLSATSSTTKIPREREDDDMADEPAAKRSKTDEEAPALESTPEFKKPNLPPVDTNVNGVQAEQTPKTSLNTITKPQFKHIQRVLQNVKRIHDARFFVTPVDIAALNIPNYPNIVKNPMDLRTMEEKLKAEDYPSVDAFYADFNLIVSNSVLFNGPEHAVSKAAGKLKDSFDRQMQNIPGPEVTEVSAADKKKRASVPSATPAPPPRRESRSSLPGSARSPTASSPQTFALGPQGVPLIRRDSTVGDGRPKREIHPPAPRDLPYANQKPKKKKFQMELKFCSTVMAELQKPKFSSVSYPFLLPVDPVALNIPHYHKIIKKPMDLGTVGTKLDHGEYENAKEFEADVQLMFKNCFTFNPPDHPVHQMGQQFKDVFEKKMEEKQRWVDANTPASGPASPGSSRDSEDEEEEEEEEDEGENEDQLTQLQKQIAAMSKQVEMIQKQGKGSPPASSKKAKSHKKATKKASSTAPIKAEKKGPSKPSRPQPKLPRVTYEEKQDISNRINGLPEEKMQKALRIIRDNMPHLKGSNEEELELDIDELPDVVLRQLLRFVHENSSHRASARPPPPAPPVATAPARKKNKPMSKTEQEARIEQVRGRLETFKNPNAMESLENHTASKAEETSGDEDDSEESEEE